MEGLARIVAKDVFPFCGPALQSEKAQGPHHLVRSLFTLSFLHLEIYDAQTRHSPTLLAEYAFFLRPGGILYTITGRLLFFFSLLLSPPTREKRSTDVRDLYEWTVKHLDEHPLFLQLTDDELRQDAATIAIVTESTEESKKVSRNGGEKFLACYRRLPSSKFTAETSGTSE